MPDIVKLGFEADASQLTNATKALDDLSAAGKGAAGAVDKVKTSTEGAAKTAASSDTSMRRLASSMDRLVAAARLVADSQKGMGDRVASEAKRTADSMAEIQKAVAAQGAAIDKAVQAMEKAVKAMDEMATAHRQAGAEARNHVSLLDGLGNKFGQLSNLLGPLKGIIAGAFTIEALRRFTMEVAQAGQQIQMYQARIAAMVGSQQAANTQFERLYALSQKLGTGLDSSVDVFQRLAQNADALGATNADITRVIETVQKLGKVSGTSTGELNSSIMQLGQALASGRLSGDELRAILENMPPLARAIADGLNVSVGALRDMGATGQLTGDKVFQALLKAGQKADEQFAKLPDTMEQAQVRMQNATTALMAEIDRQLGASEKLRDVWNAVAKSAEATQKAIKPADAFSNAAAQSSKLNNLLEFKNKSSNESALTRVRRVITGDTINVTSLEDQIEAQRKLATQANNTALAQLRRADAAAMQEEADKKAAKAAIDQQNALAELRNKANLVIEGGRLMTESDRDLEKWQTAVNKAMADGSPHAQQLAAMLANMAREADPLASALKGINDEIAALKVPEGAERAAFLALQGINKTRVGKGESPLDTNSIEFNDLYQAETRKATAASEAQIAARKNVIDIEKRLAGTLNQTQRARLETELKVEKAVASGVDRTVAANEAGQDYAVTVAGINAQLGQQATQLSVAAKAQMALAQAAGKGEAAMRAAAAANKLAAERANPNGNPGAVAQANAVEEAAAVLRIRNETVAALEQETVANNEMAAALLSGVEAVKAAERAEYSRQLVMKLGTDQTEAYTAAMKAYDEALASRGGKSYTSAVQSQKEQVELLGLERSLLTESDAVRAKAIKHQELLNEAQRIGKDWSQAQRDEWVKTQDALYDSRTEIDRQKAAWTALGDTLDKAFERVGDALVQIFVEGKGAAVDFGSITKGIIASILTDLMKMAVVNPLKNMITGGNAPTLFDALTGAGKGVGATPSGSGVNAGSLISTGQSVYSGLTGSTAATMANAGTWFAQTSVGHSMGLSTAYPMMTGGGAAPVTQVGTIYAQNSAGTALSSTLGEIGAGLPYGAIGGLGGAAIGNATGSKAIGAVSGAALGAGSAALGSYLIQGAMMGPWGLAAAAIVGGIMAAIGTQKPTVGPTASADVTISKNGKSASYGNVQVDNEGDVEAGKQLGQALSAIYTTAASGGGKLAKEFGVGRTAAKGMYVAGSVPYKEFGEDVAGLMRYTLLEQGGLTGAGKGVTTAIQNSKAKDFEESAKDIAVGAAIDAGNTALDALVDTLESLGKAAKEAQTEALSPMLDDYERAKKLGLGQDYADMVTRSATTMLQNLVTPPDITETQQKMVTLHAQFEALGDVLSQITPALKDQVTTYEAMAMAKLRADVTKQGQRDLLEAQGKGYINNIRDIEDGRKSLKSDYTALGIDTGLADQIADAKLKTLFEGLSLPQLREAIGTFSGGVKTIAEAVLAASSQVRQANQDLEVRTLRAKGMAGAADDMELKYQQQEEYLAAVEAGYDATYLAGLKYVQGLETQAAALVKSQAALERTTDLTARLATLQGNSVQATVSRLALQQAQETTNAVNSGWSSGDLATLSLVQNAEMAKAVNEANRQALLDAIDKQITTLQQTNTTLTEANGRLLELRSTLKDAADAAKLNSSITPLTPEQQLAEARRQFEAQVAIYNDASLDSDARYAAGQKLSGLGQAVMEAAKAYDPTNLTDWNRVMEVWTTLGGVSDTDLEIQKKQLESNTKQISELQKMRETYAAYGEKTAGSIGDLKDAFLASSAVVQRALERLPNSTGSTTDTLSTMIGAITRETLPSIVAWAKTQGADAYQQVLAGASNKLGWENNPYRYQSPSDVANLDSLGFQSSDALGWLSQRGYSGGWDNNANAFIVSHGLSDQFTQYLRDWKSQHGGTATTPAETVEQKRQRLLAFSNSDIEAAFGGMPDIIAARASDPAFNLARWFLDHGINEVLAGSRTIPGFATGGRHMGGLRTVGEYGIEVEATGPSRIWNQSQMGQAVLAASLGQANDNRDVVRALDRLSNQLDALIRISAQAGDDNNELLEQVAENVQAVVTVAAANAGVRS